MADLTVGWMDVLEAVMKVTMMAGRMVYLLVGSLAYMTAVVWVLCSVFQVVLLAALMAVSMVD
jgi:hypothetical protein